jgi:Leucine-rich repeat (LRR) protein
MFQRESSTCSICGSYGTNKSTCPNNPIASINGRDDLNKHYNCKTGGGGKSGQVTQRKKKIIIDYSKVLELLDKFPRYNKLTHSPQASNLLKNLREIDISANLLTEIPAEIGDLINLEHLHLNGNQLTEIPAKLGNLTNLIYLNINSNQLTELPPELGNLQNLSILDLSINLLTQLPPELGNLTNLIRLNSSYNRLTEIPPELGNLQNLRYLYLSSNKLTEIPCELGQLVHLEVLYLNKNPIIDIDLYNLTNTRNAVQRVLKELRYICQKRKIITLFAHPSANLATPYPILESLWHNYPPINRLNF